MTSIADSDALFSRMRVLAQHLAALILVQTKISDPDCRVFRWLDLACGRGQMIAFLDKNLSPSARAKLAYSAFDIDQRFVRDTQKLAESMGLASVLVKIGDLCDFPTVLNTGEHYDFVTLTNTVHEVAPHRLARVLVDAILHLADDGTLFIYDMERLGQPELGAVPWQHADIREIVNASIGGLGSTHRPEVGQWQHSTATGWNVHICRKYLAVPRADAIRRRENAIEQAAVAIRRLLRQRLTSCEQALESLTRYGAETADEEAEKSRLLHELWSVFRALGDER